MPDLDADRVPGLEGQPLNDAGQLGLRVLAAAALTLSPATNCH